MTAACVPGVQLIYADNDMIGGPKNRGGWCFKPAWSPELLAAFNYIGDFALMRREIVRALGGWRAEGNDVHHDLLLRLTGEVGPACDRALGQAVHHATDASAEPATFPTPKRALPEPAPRVSLIIPTRDGAEVLSTCIRSIREKTRLSGLRDHHCRQWLGAGGDQAAIRRSSRAIPRFALCLIQARSISPPSTTRPRAKRPARSSASSTTTSR